MQTIIKENLTSVVLGVLIIGVLGLNLSLLSGIQGQITGQEYQLAAISLAAPSAGNSGVSDNGGNSAAVKDGEIDQQAFFDEFVPKGVPDIYGDELGVSFDEVVASLDILKALDGDLYPTGELKYEQLTETQKERYIEVGQSISCEFCCSAKFMTATNGKPACGCAHSAAMRGLAMYLLINHEDEYTNAEILDELTNWKIMFFPKQMIQKALDLQAGSGEITTTSLNELPDMVGGC